MILYYAAGGGLGHLTRARAFLHGAGAEGDAVVLTASPFATDRRVMGGVAILLVPPELRADVIGYRAWLQRQLLHLAPSRIILDTFPAGLFHEFDGMTMPCAVDYVARYLVWPRYAAMRNPPRFATTYVLEPLHEEQERFILERSTDIDRNPLLIDPPAEGNDVATMPSLPTRYSLVIHSGDAGEVSELIAYAEEIRKAEGGTEPIIAATSSPVERLGVTGVDRFPANHLSANAVRIITAAGFNCMRQLSADTRHRALPFPRRFDDQFLRASRSRQRLSS